MVLSWVVERRTWRDEEKLRAGVREGICECGIDGISDDGAKLTDHILKNVSII